MTRITFVALLVLGSLSFSVIARAEDRAALASLAGRGTEVYVTYIDGIERRGRLAGVSDDGLRITFGGRVTVVPWEEIVTVDRRGDPVGDGALKGAGIAVALYGLGALAAGARADEALSFAASAALAWGTVGAIVDALNVGRTRVFVSPAATLTTRAVDPGQPRDGAVASGPRGVVVGVTVGF